MRRRILAIPSVGDLDAFGRLVAHVAHYFSHAKPERIAIFVDRTLREAADAWLASPSLPPGFDPQVLARIEAIRDAIALQPWPGDYESLVLNTEIVLDWNIERSSSEPWASMAPHYRAERTRFTIDWQHTRLGAASLAEAARFLVHGRHFDRSQADRMVELRDQLGRADRAYLVATGPSAREALKMDLSDGVRIVCNTVVLDDELMDHIRPNVLTFADPIFHFGPSTYAQQFQRAVLQQAQKHDFSVITTERYAYLLRSHLPDIAERIIGLRQGSSGWVDNFDLVRQPAVRPYPNVLTMLMLPIAATLARSIELLGFDGRDPDDDYFWRHGSTVQFEKELEEIRGVHPGFFDLDYADYYAEHIATVERLMGLLDDRGVDCRSAVDSHIPALRRRTTPPAITPPSASDSRRHMLVSITPDWIGDFAHFGPYERRVHEASEQAGLKHVALGSLGLRSSAGWEIPTFSEPSFRSAFDQFPPVGRRFECELRGRLADLRPAPGSAVFFYTADVWHLGAILATASEYPRVRFAANLMRSHAWIEAGLHNPNPWTESLVDLLRYSIQAAEGTNVTLAVDTEALARDVHLLTGRSIGVWPMIAVSSGPHEGGGNELRNGIGHIVCPVHAQDARGFPELVALAEAVGARLGRGELKLTARWPIAGASKRIVDLAGRFEELGGRLIRDNLSDAEFGELVRSADIVLVPYRIRPFRTRTSGVAIDALLAGKPVVAVRGTWAGQLVERYGVGLTYTDGDVHDMERALSGVLENGELYRRRVAEATGRITDEFSPVRLIEFLTSPTARDVPDAAAVTAVCEKTEGMRRLHRWHVTSETDVRIDAAVAEDDQRRSADHWRDEADRFQRAMARRDRAATMATKKRPPKPANSGGRAYPREAHAHLDELAVVAALVDPDGTKPGWMIDVGAHHGSAFSHFLAKGWQIHAFEPDTRHADYLAERFANHERITLDRRAVTDATGDEQVLYTSPESPGVSSLLPFLDSHADSGKVETIALKDVLPNRHVELLKVDTEGFDLPVLRGYPWERDRPDVVVCEFEDRKTTRLNYTINDLAAFLVDRGYQVWISEWHPVVRYGIRHDWHRLVRYPSRLASSNAWGNLIAFQEPRSERELAAAVAACLEVGNPQAVIRSSRVRRIARQILPRARRKTIAAALRGWLRPALVASGILGVLAGALAIAGNEMLALLSLAAAMIASTIGSLVVAVRLQRRA